MRWTGSGTRFAKKSLTTCRRGRHGTAQRKVVKTQTKLSRRRFLAHVSVIAATMAPVATIALGGLSPGNAALSGADPIFAVIAEHKAAIETWIALDDKAKSDEVLDYEGAVFKTLFTTVPTTVAAVAALFEPPGTPEDFRENNIVPTIR